CSRPAGGTIRRDGRAVQGSSLARGGSKPERTAAQPLARRARGGKPRVKLAKRVCNAPATTEYGEMAERFKAPVLKTGEGSNLPWVRIPLSPPDMNVNY